MTRQVGDSFQFINVWFGKYSTQATRKQLSGNSPGGRKKMLLLDLTKQFQSTIHQFKYQTEPLKINLSYKVPSIITINIDFIINFNT